MYIFKCTIQTDYPAKATKKLAHGPREDFKQIIIGFSVCLKFNVYLGLEPRSIRSIFKYNCNKYKLIDSAGSNELQGWIDLRSDLSQKDIEMYRLSGSIQYRL